MVLVRSLLIVIKKNFKLVKGETSGKELNREIRSLSSG